MPHFKDNILYNSAYNSQDLSINIYIYICEPKSVGLPAEKRQDTKSVGDAEPTGSARAARDPADVDHPRSGSIAVVLRVNEEEKSTL